MKTPVLLRLLGAVLALSVGLVSGRTAEESPAPIANEEAPPAPAPAEAPAAPEKSELRRLDVEEPATPPEPTTEATESPEVAASSGAEQTKAPSTRESDPRVSRVGERVQFWGNATLDENESAEVVLSIVGSSTAAGHVRDSVVSILGSSTASGDVRGGVVSVFGSSRVTGGTVGDVVVSVFGNTYVNGRVRGEVFAVLGNVELGPDAVIEGEVVCVGGALKRDPQAIVHNDIKHIGLGFKFSGFEGLHAWVDQCLKYGRPLAFGPNLMWAWWIAIGFLVLYFFLAALFPRTVERCLLTLEQRPGYSILTALLVTLITPLAAILLVMTVIGTPALAVFLLVSGLFGKMVMTAWIGSRITKLASAGAHPAIAVLVGGVIVLLLYTIPVVGFLVAKLLSWLGLGVVVYTIILTLRSSRAARAPVSVAAVPRAPVATPPTSPPPVQSADSGSVGVASAGFTGASAAMPPPMSTGSAAIPPPPVMAAPVMISAATLHRAGFWIRIAASALDVLLVAVAVNLLPDLLEPNFLLAYAAYCIVLWALKGTTIGGIVCNLKIVRLDDQPVDWSTALVRALGGFLSLFAAGIGFIWVAFDDQRQSWHDKIAGTTIVHVPKGVSLV